MLNENAGREKGLSLCLLQRQRLLDPEVRRLIRELREGGDTQFRCGIRDERDGLQGFGTVDWALRYRPGGANIAVYIGPCLVEMAAQAVRLNR